MICFKKITTATYNVDGYYLGESSQGLGYSNMIYIHLQLQDYEKNVDQRKVNMYFLEEPESHMHPQMQRVFIKYLLNKYQIDKTQSTKKDNSIKQNENAKYQLKIQGMITTHSDEMVRAGGISRLRVSRHIANFSSKLYDLSTLVNELNKRTAEGDEELLNFFDWFFEVGFSEIVFADKVIFYEGDTERLFIRKVMMLEEYEKLRQQYIAFIQVGGAYAKNYEKLIRFLEIKSLIITDIDYEKMETEIDDILNSKSTNATINHFYKKSSSSANGSCAQLYEWNKIKQGTLEDIIYVCFQTDEDGYARTLEEAMLNKYFSIQVDRLFKKSEWEKKRTESKLKFSIPSKIAGKNTNDDTEMSVRNILVSTSGNKTDFMYSVIAHNYVKKMLPKYIEGGLKWLME